MRLLPLSLAVLAANAAAGPGQRPAVAGASKPGRIVPFSVDKPCVNVCLLTERGAWKHLPDTDKLASRGVTLVRAEASPKMAPGAAFIVALAVYTSLTPPFLKNNPGRFRYLAHATADFSAQNIAFASSAPKLPSIIERTMNAQGAA